MASIPRFRTLVAALLLPLLPAFAAEAGTPDARFDRIEKLLGEVRAELDSLERESKDAAARVRRPAADSQDAIWNELLTERERTLARATRTTMHTKAAGYVFNPNLLFGMGYLQWFEPWGLGVDAGTVWVEDLHRVGANASLLRSIDRFTAFDLETHLYGFVGMGFLWADRKESGDTWYDTPDLSLRWQVGAGSEISMFNVGGIRMVPEVGLQAVRFLSRYQDSENYPTSADVPRSDFALNLYLALHINFYFE